ncbi:RabGAP/TBC [Fomes fomentarius]|nr:RabGAP/TBC [Fomes fomentarius]
MSEGTPAVQGDVAPGKTLTPLTTEFATPSPASATDADENETPTSPELKTVVATKPPTQLGAPKDEEKPSQSLSAILESSTEHSAAADTVGDADAEEGDRESSAAAEAKAESVSSPELTSIPLSPADPPSRSPAVPPFLTQLPISPKHPTQPSESNASASPLPRADRPPSTHQPSRPLADAGLDSLLSPTETEAKFSTRQSVASSDVTDDDTRFSTVLLSARQSLAGTPKTAVSSAPNELHTVDEGTGSEESTLVEDWRKHKKTASNSTILSENNVPYLISKLAENGDSKRRSRPGSLMVSQQITEDVYENQGEEAYVDPETTVDWDFWGQVMNDYQGFASQHPEQLARAIEKGIPKSLRGMVWQLMSASKDPELENTYLRLLKEKSQHEKAILRDLGRTFPHHAFFTDGHGIGQENLFNVLKAYSLYDPQVGYCQGLPFIVAILLLNMPDEEAFCLLVRLMHSYDLRGHFLPDMPKLQQRLFQFERLLEEVLPVLHLHFVRQGIKASMYCSQWFLTMFSYRFPMDIVFRIYDNCLASGIEAMFAFSMALLSKNETTLLTMKFDQLIGFLNQRVFEVYQVGPLDPSIPPANVKYRVDEFVQDAFSLRISPFMLDNYAHEYEDLVRARDAHRLEMENLRNTNQRLAQQVKKLESSLAQLNTEHCEVLNELVRSRLRHEELEGELVRYKLLYAEAMHQSEDAMSSHRISLVSKRGSNSTNN